MTTEQYKDCDPVIVAPEKKIQVIRENFLWTTQNKMDYIYRIAYIIDHRPITAPPIINSNKTVRYVVNKAKEDGYVLQFIDEAIDFIKLEDLSINIGVYLSKFDYSFSQIKNMLSLEKKEHVLTWKEKLKEHFKLNDEIIIFPKQKYSTTLFYAQKTEKKIIGYDNLIF